MSCLRSEKYAKKLSLLDVELGLWLFLLDIEMLPL
jgi:hypothetical protein